jgi:hypothetical protein
MAWIANAADGSKFFLSWHPGTRIRTSAPTDGDLAIGRDRDGFVADRQDPHTVPCMVRASGGIFRNRVSAAGRSSGGQSTSSPDIIATIAVYQSPQRAECD